MRLTEVKRFHAMCLNVSRIAVSFFFRRQCKNTEMPPNGQISSEVYVRHADWRQTMRHAHSFRFGL